MTIRLKMILAGLAVTLSLGLLTLLTRYNIDQTQSLMHGEVMVSTVEADMLGLRRYEKEFLARKQVRYFDHFEAASRRLTQDLESLRGLLPDTAQKGERFEALEQALNGYGATFREVVGLQRKIGLDEKHGLYGSLRESVHQAERSIDRLGDFRLLADLLMLRRNEKDFMLRQDLAYLKKFDHNFETLAQALGYASLGDGPRQQIRQELDHYRSDFHALVAANQALGLSPDQGKLGEMRERVHQAEEMLKGLNQTMRATLDQATTSLMVKAIALSLTISLLLLLLLLAIGRSIERPLQALAGRLQDIAEGDGDLTKTLDASGKDEFAQLARSFNTFTAKLREVIIELTSAIDELASAAAQGAATAEQSRKGMLLEQSETEQVATAMNEMVATVQEVARNASSAAVAAQQVQQAASEGDRVAHSTGKTINTLADEVQTAAAAVKKLEADSDNIGTILDAIRNIADQTNLLALNAAIEAARAGESGRGFAVVADEVRTLAQRTQGSIEEIQQIIERLQTNVNDANRTMQAGLQRTESGVEEVTQTRQAIEEINQAVHRISDMNTQIASAAEEQSSVAESINQSVVNIAEVAHRTAGGAQEAVRTNQSLSELANQLQRLAGQFIV